MSLAKGDRKVRSKSGKVFSPQANAGACGPPFAAAISEALRREFGATSAGVTKVMRLTSANPRAVKNWFDAKNGPSGENLVRLLRYSDDVLETVLALAGRAELVRVHRVAGLRDKLRQMLVLLDEGDVG